ncbi:MAG TPA: hypothetical protein VES79_07125, partial [Solirubrobacteraceae bacterium]|nr:hypothetical protein [Solirubrobacteraceae bacterium]
MHQISLQSALEDVADVRELDRFRPDEQTSGATPEDLTVNTTRRRPGAFNQCAVAADDYFMDESRRSKKMAIDV